MNKIPDGLIVVGVVGVMSVTAGVLLRHPESAAPPATLQECASQSVHIRSIRVNDNEDGADLTVVTTCDYYHRVVNPEYVVWLHSHPKEAADLQK